MHLHQSNRLEVLFHQLCAVMQESLADPLTPEIIVVHNQGMAQWVSQQIAFATGIAAHIHFPLPARLVWELLHRLAGEAAEKDLFSKPVLRWRLAALLPQFLRHPAFGEIAAYLQNDPDGTKLYQLAGKISDVFDQYLTYRPDLLIQWEEGAGEGHWQALLWRHLAATANSSRARLSGQFRHILDTPAACGADLPRRFHLFGINSLAPVYLDIIEQVSRRAEVHLFHLSPCRHYWGDLVSARQLALREKQEDVDAFSAGEAYYEQGNPLLVSLGRTGQDFFRQLLDCPFEESDLYQQHDGKHLLASLHNDILDLVDRSAPAQDRHALQAEDRSLQFHVCFSPLREIQVLHDRLLDLFQEFPDLTPGDILVTAPDIQRYASALAGVFGEAGQERRIPWSIADRSLHQEQPVVRCFLELLTVLDGRFTASAVLALCESEALRSRFGLDPAILPRLHAWVREAGICWGLDQQHRRELGVHAATQHSWRFGLDRLLLGYLMGDCRQAYADLLPYAHLASGESEALGGLIALIDTLSVWRLRLKESRSGEQWCRCLLEMLSDFFPGDVEEQGLFTLRQAINALKEECLLAGYTGQISAAVINHHLEAALTQPDGGQAFLSGRVTFCNMVPMRSVPFRVVCLLGMNDGDFPRVQHPAAFDLMAREPRLGDRNRRNDDRYLFLEALLSARDVLYLSWVGRNLRDDGETPPSVVVRELQDYLNLSCAAPAGSASAFLTTWHPMQPFSRRCFDAAAATASYNGAWQPAGRESAPTPFLGGPLPSPGPEWQTVELRRLARFWRRPVYYFLQEILGLQLRQEDAGIADSEPFALDRLQQYQVRQATVRELLGGMLPEQVGHNLTSSGSLPQGGFGLNAFAGIVKSSASLATQLQPLLAAPRPPLEIEQTIGRFRLTGWLPDLTDRGRVTWRAGALKGADLMEWWIHHLALNLAAPADVPLRSYHLARETGAADDSVALHTLNPVEGPETYLAHLLAGYWQGLSQPLPFFPETSRAWAEAVESGKEAEKKARQVWEGGFQWPGEGDDPAYAYFFRQADPLNDDFVKLAALFLPIFRHLESDHATP